MRMAGQAVVVGVVLVGVLAGCGDDEPGATPSGSGSSSSQGPTANSSGGATPPGGGSVDETVPPVEVATAEPVPLDQPAVSDGVTLTITSIKEISLKATTPGDIAGPGVAVTVTAKNGSQAPVDLGNAYATLTQGDGTVATPSTAEPYVPFSDTIEPGAEARATYVFLVNKEKLNPATILVSHAPGATQVQFTGDIS